MKLCTALCLAACLAVLPCLAMAACPYAHANQELLSRTRSLLDTTSPAYLESVKTLDLKAVKADIAKLLTSSDPTWPADFGYYGGLFIRLAWHCAGSYRTWDGRGGCDGGRIRFAPEAEWPDNTNLDKARKLLEPIKEKYGDKLSWGDLIVIAGNTAVETAGGPTLPLCLGRVDDTDGTASIELGPSKEQEAIAPCNVAGACEKPLGPTTMGLIYVNPEGPLGQPKPEISCQQIRDTFGRMGMNDSETVALIGGGHAFGKAHGACTAGPGMCGVGEMKGKGPNTVTSGFEGPWTTDPTRWSNEYFTNLLGYEWTVRKGPGGHFQWKPTAVKATVGVANSAAAAKKLPGIMMLTADVSLLKDPEYLKIVQQFATDQKAFEEAFKAAFYKLTTRDMGPSTRCVNVDNSLPAPYPWQCPLPEAPKDKPDYQKVAADVSKILTPANAGLFTTLAWQSASTYRQTDHMGGTNGARIQFSPMKDWSDNKGLDEGLKLLQPIKAKFPTLSMADLIVLAGTMALQNSDVKFYGGRVDATEACAIDAELKPRVYQSWVVSLKDDAKVKGLTLKQYVALMATPRSTDQSKAAGYTGTWSADAQKLSNAYFQTLLAEKWENGTSASGVNEFKASGKSLYTTPADAALTQDPELTAIVKEFAADNAAFLKQYAESWTAMMNAGVDVGSGIALGGSSSTSTSSKKNGAFVAAALRWSTAALAMLAAVLML